MKTKPINIIHAIILCITVVMALSLTTPASGAPTAPDVVAFEDFDGGDINLSGTTNVYDYQGGTYIAGADGGSSGDVFGRVSAFYLGGTGMPFDVADDTIADVGGGGVYPSDTLGMAGQHTTAFFAMNDMDGSGVNGNTFATWTFDISSASAIADIEIDLAALGDFEASSSDGFMIEARIDANAYQTIFLATTDEDASNTYRALDGGYVPLLNDPLQLFIDGSGTPVGFLDKSDPTTGDFDTYTSTLLNGQSGSTLDVRVSWTGLPSGSEPMGIDNITIYGGTATTTDLDASAACNGDDLDVTITAGDPAFDITGTGTGLPINGVSTGVHTITGPGSWTGVTVTELGGENESINLGDFTCPYISLQKDDEVDPVLPGDPITYTLAYAYNGPTTAVSVTLTDTLPAAVVFSSVDSDQGTCGEASGEVVCELGTVTIGQTVNVTITVDSPIEDQYVFNIVEAITTWDSNSRLVDDSEITQVGDPPIPDIWINEVDADTASDDVLEFVELYDGGNGYTILDDLVVVFYNGNGDTSYNAFDLDGYTTNADGYFLLGNSGVTPAPDITFPGNGLQNGADAVAIYNADGADFPNGTAVITTNLTAAVVYDTNDDDDDGLLILLDEGQPQLNEGGENNKDYHSNQRCPNGRGGLRETEGFLQSESTPGEQNNCPAPLMIINEVDADTAGTDTLEFVELYDGGKGNTLLNGVVVVLYNGSGDTSYAAYDLDEYETNAEGYFVLGNAGVTPAPDIIFADDFLQNGADAVAVYEANGVDFPNGTLTTTTNLMDAFVYDTDQDDDTGLLGLLNPGQPQVNENGGFDKDYQSSQRCPDGFGGGRNTDTYIQDAPTPGTGGPCGFLGACGGPAYGIHEVQGDGDATPMEGATDVIIEGMVVGDFQLSDQLNGFYLQEETVDIDGNPETSEGIFVYDPAYTLPLNILNIVRVRGTATEFYDVTQLTSITDMAVCPNLPLKYAVPSILDLPVADVSDFEHYEGMVVVFSDTLTASQNYFQGRYGQVTLSEGGRLYQPTQLFAPASTAMFDMVDENLRRMIVLDDDTTQQNPNPIPYIGASDTLRAGDVVFGLTGVMDYGLITSGYDINHYRLRPVLPVYFLRTNPRPWIFSWPNPNQLRVASFNVFNFFNGDGQTGGFPTSRGADSMDEYIRQTRKIIEALIQINADVVGLMEIENDAPPFSAIQDLVNTVNNFTYPGNYDFIDTGIIGTDEIKVALIYRPSEVTPLGSYAILDSSAHPDYNSDMNRPALAQTFQDNATGEIFTVVVNHLKSKGSDCDDIGDPNLNDGQGNCPNTRTSAAIAEAEWLATNPTGYATDQIVIIGDLNAYAMEDPIVALTDRGYTNLLADYIGPYAYSYIFDGGSGTLDYALASPVMTAKVDEVRIWHINADEPSVIDYNLEYKPEDLYTETPFRASDHDPVVVDFNIGLPWYYFYLPLILTP